MKTLLHRILGLQTAPVATRIIRTALILLFAAGSFHINGQTNTNNKKEKPCELRAEFSFETKGNVVAFHVKSNTGYYYFWEFGDNSNGKGKSIRHKYSKPGTYEVCVTVKDKAERCKIRICKKITIKERPCTLKADFAFDVNGNVVGFKAKANEDAKFFWSFGDGKEGRGQALRHEYRKPGTYEVCLKVVSKDKRCTFRICHKVTIKERPCNLKADFRFDTDGLFAKFAAESNNGEHYGWDFGDGTATRGKDARHEYAKPGIYVVCLTVVDKDNRCRIKVCKKIEVKKPCRLEADFKIEYFGNTVKFYAKSNEGEFYKWDMGDGTSESGAEIKHEYKKDGVYKVCLTVYDKEKRCSVTVCHEVKISSRNQLILNVYPNPATDFIVLNLSDNAKFNAWQIKDLYGKVLLSDKFRDAVEKVKIDISNLPKGLYVAEVYSPEGTVQIKFMKN